MTFNFQKHEKIIFKAKKKFKLPLSGPLPTLECHEFFKWSWLKQVKHNRSSRTEFSQPDPVFLSLEMIRDGGFWNLNSLLSFHICNIIFSLSLYFVFSIVFYFDFVLHCYMFLLCFYSIWLCMLAEIGRSDHHIDLPDLIFLDKTSPKLFKSKLLHFRTLIIKDPKLKWMGMKVCSGLIF